MRIKLITIGSKHTNWVTEGYAHYAKRLPPAYQVRLQEIPLLKRSKNCDIQRLMAQEGEQLLNATGKNDIIIALDSHGTTWDSEGLATQVSQWHELGRPISLLIGGPDGLSKACLESAHLHWSLSPLTLPHPLVRLMVIEQLYRAFTLLQNHPYHR